MHLGIDLGGTKIEVAVLDSEDQFILRKRIASPQDDYQKTLAAITDLVKKTEATVSTKCSIGIGIPGSLHPESGLVQNANSTWLIGRDLKTDICAILDRPVAIANDADCFTLSETKDGAAKGATAVFGVILGTGVGGGVCFNGKLGSGVNSIRGEWGHNAMHYLYIDQHDSTACYCGRHHCIETYLSGPALIQRFNTLAQQRVTRAEDILGFERSGNPIASKCMTDFYEHLGVALAQVVNLLDPDVIVLGGGLSNIEGIYEFTPSHIATHLFSDKLRTTLIKAKHGDSSGVRGAAWLGKESAKEIQND